MSGKENVRAPAIRWLREPLYDQDGVQATSGLDDKGQEHPDPVPMAVPIGLSVAQGDPLREALRSLMQEQQSQFMAAVMAEGFESEEEANDFAVEDDLYPADPGLPWEGPFDFTEAQEAEERARRKAADELKASGGGGSTPQKIVNPEGPVGEARASSEPAKPAGTVEPTVK